VTHEIGTLAVPNYVDKRRSYKDDFESRVVSGPVYFTANAGGTTTTLVGALSNASTAVNVARIGDEFKIFTAANAVKHETIFRITAIAIAGSQTLTFTPAAPVATVSGDYIREVGLGLSTGEKDRRLVDLGYSLGYIAKLTENDKDYQLRTSDDPGSI
jgi:hypothetical protein